MTIDERFDAKVDRTGGPDACWLWTAYRRPHGYGQFGVGRSVVGAHRFALEREIGRALVTGECALHSCDTPSCVNPTHLRVGSHSDNMADKAARGRVVNRPLRGEVHPGAKLTDVKVEEIRAIYTAGGVSQRELAARFGLAQSRVSFIVNHKVWRHVQ